MMKIIKRIIAVVLVIILFMASFIGNCSYFSKDGIEMILKVFFSFLPYSFICFQKRRKL